MKYSLKEKLKRKILTIGSWITLDHTSIAEIMANAGFDWLVVDMEHSAITVTGAQQLIMTLELCGCTPLVRVGANDPTLIKRVMDAGAYGVIVPMINTAEDALKAVDAVKYPPAGKRGVGLARAQAYGLSFDKYIEWLAKESVVIVQIEHICALKNLPAILSTPGVDGFIVGPYDLSASLGFPGEFENPLVVEALCEIKKVVKKSPIAAGYHVVQPDPDMVFKKIREGYRFLGYSLDTLFLGCACKTGLDLIRKSELGETG